MTKDETNSRKPKEKAVKQIRKQKPIRNGGKQGRVNTATKMNVFNSSQGENKGKASCSTSDLKANEFERGSLVWVRIKGFPWWPGIIVSESDVPEKQKKVLLVIRSFP